MMIQLRQALRRLCRSPGFTLATVLTLAIGIGATTAIFTVVNGILLRPLPFPESDRLVALTHESPGADSDVRNASPAIYFTYRDNNRTFESVALWFANAATITGSGDPEEIQAVRATYEFLPTLRVRPLLGRDFTAADDAPGSPSTVMLSYRYWERRFGGDRSVLGRSLTIDGAPHEIVAVLPSTFRFLEQQADILTPAQLVRASQFAGPIGERGIARLREGVTLEDASADVARMIPILYESFPIIPGLTRELLEAGRFGPHLLPLQKRVASDLGDVLSVLMGTIGILLLIACANVANLQLVRTEKRGHELAIRAALGAGWPAIARTLLVDSLLLGAVGGVLGVALAVAALPALLSVAAGQLPSALDVGIDSRVLLFALGVSIAAGLLVGSIPIVKYARPRLISALHAAATSYSTSRVRGRARNSLVVAQVSLALILLVASGLMIRSFQALRTVDPGVRAPEHVQTLRIAIARQAAMRDFAAVIRTENAIADRLAEVAGVEAVAYSTRVPLIATGPSGPFSFENTPDAAPLGTEFRYVSPGWFRTVGAPLLAGRDLEWTDTYESRQVVVVSESLANRQWGSPEAALGKRMRRSANAPWLEVIGVAGDIRHNGVAEPAPVTVYISQSEFVARFASSTVFYFVRSERVGTPGFVDDLAHAIWTVSADVPLGSVQTLGDVYRTSIARTSLTLVLLAITASMALLLGVIGIYGVIAYMLTQRTREIGIRMALGARGELLKLMVLKEVLGLVGIGVALGLAGAVTSTRLMSALLFGVSALDPITYFAVCALLVSAALTAAYLPARRATRVDPMQALRAE